MSSLFSNRQNGGCLGLTNIQYIFKDAYFTSIIKTDTCSEVTFKRSLNFSKYIGEIYDYVWFVDYVFQYDHANHVMKDARLTHHRSL